MSALATRFIRRWEAFRRDQSGSFATITGVSIVAIMLCAGIALDYSRISHTKSLINDALDAAVLAAGSELSSGKASGQKLEQNFRDFFDANLQGRSVDLGIIDIAEFRADEASGKINATARARIPTTLLALTGTSEVEIDIPVEAVFATDDIEVAMVLDVTASMTENDKINSLRDAARDAVKILLPTGSSADRMRIGIVPYSSAVNAGSRYGPIASSGRASQLNNYCVTERGGPQAATDASYSVSPVRAETSDCPSQSIVPLSSDTGQLVSEISSLSASGFTAGHLGIAWGYYMLSANWRSLWPDDARPANYTDPVRKIAIIMTDGMFNTYYYGVDGDENNQEARSSSTAKALCTDMKRMKGGKPGITIYTIAFDAPAQAEQLLRDCATPDIDDSRHFFSASDGQELRAAFSAIASDIRNLRLSR